VQSSNGEVFLPSSNGDDSTAAVSDSTSRLVRDSLLSSIQASGFQAAESSHSSCSEDEAAQGIWNDEMKGSIVAGFQSGVRAGPICEEPVFNVLVIIEGVEVAVVRQEYGNQPSWTPSKPISGGMVVAALRMGIRCALLTRPARLMEGHLKLTLHTSLAGIGALYQVLNKRRGRVLEDSMVDGTDLLMITALIPQAEAFGLAPELFGKTSGEVTAPEMVFSHWERLNVDPFWIPTTEEEREDFGELETAGDASTGIDNTALKYIRSVRQRKGLRTDSSRTVVAAEKQRTLKR
jgi:ribosome assembly protein 1